MSDNLDNTTPALLTSKVTMYGGSALGAACAIYSAVYGAKFLHTATMGSFYGTGNPEGVLSASIGSTYHRTDGGAGTSFYVKESGTGSTGWVAK